MQEQPLFCLFSLPEKFPNICYTVRELHCKTSPAPRGEITVETNTEGERWLEESAALSVAWLPGRQDPALSPAWAGRDTDRRVGRVVPLARYGQGLCL